MSGKEIMFTPVNLGAIQLKNRLVMAPLTRMRAVAGHVPNPLAKIYYAQRASAGLIITEATQISPIGMGYPATPGIYTAEQTAAWKEIVEAVHAKGGSIVSQLWHVGRISHSSLHPEHGAPEAPSAIPPAGQTYGADWQLYDYEVPKAMSIEDIARLLKEYELAAQNAKAAGFDGVEIHAANGYLLDQFLQDKTNQRQDEYGGSIENRARLMLEVADAVMSVWGADRVGMHLAPRGDAHDMGDSNPLATFGYVARELGKRHLAFICARESLGDNRIGPQMKAAFGGSYIANEGFTQATANEVLARGEADAVAFGVPLLANPDLLERFRQNAPLNPPDQSTFYAPGRKGYTDYPVLQRTM